MLTLEEILRRFTAVRALEPPTRAALEPVRPRTDQASPMMTSVFDLIAHLAEQEKRITALESQIAHLTSELHDIHPPLR